MAGIETHQFAGASAFDDTMAFVKERAKTLAGMRSESSVRRADKVVTKAKEDDDVKLLGAVDRVVDVTLNFNDFMKLEVRNSVTGQVLFASDA